MLVANFPTGAVEMDDAERSALETDTMNALSVGGELVTPGVFNLSPVPPPLWVKIR